MTREPAGPEGWFTTFFDATANDFWAAAVPPAHTTAEADFLVRALQVRAGAALIDIAAGRGRLARPVAARGHRVTALDRSADGVGHIGRHIHDPDLSDAWPGVTVVQADMRHLPFAEAFDGGYCMGNSFGYFDHDGVALFLREVRRVLRPGARFVLESATVAESMFADFAERTVHRFGGVTVTGRHRFDPDHEHLLSTLDYDDGIQRTTRTMTQLVLPSTRIRSMVEDGGLAVEELLGGVDGQPYTAAAGSLLLIARRPAG